MIQADTLADLRTSLAGSRGPGQSIGLVPTMGFLHDGHLELARHARQQNDTLVLSIYVNPTQFGAGEDFDQYPRDLERDRHLAAEAGVDILFVPSTQTMYPGGANGQRIWVDPGPLAQHLCGASRPGHFRGVTTVVSKLLHMVHPDRAYFGQKDGQQAVILSRMAVDLAFPVEICVLPTVREPDGLALSSRNVYLLPEERVQAPALSRALTQARQAIERGERDPRQIESLVVARIQADAPLARIDYVTLADMATLQPSSGLDGQDVMLALAAYFGETRLIDNLVVSFDARGPHFR